MCVYCYYVIITFCYKVRKIQKKKIVKVVLVQSFDWLICMNECGCVHQ